MDSDLALLELWAAGDLKAGNELFGRYYESIYSFFEHKAPRAVEELVQDTLLACVSSRDRFEGRSSFRTFLFSIARHILYRHWRTMKRDERLDFHLSSVADLETLQPSKLARNEERHHLLSALRRLPLETQLLIELYYWEGLGADQLAEVFEIAPATVRSRLHRARGTLREIIESFHRVAVSDLDKSDSLEAWVRSLKEDR